MGLKWHAVVITVHPCLAAHNNNIVDAITSVKTLQGLRKRRLCHILKMYYKIYIYFTHILKFYQFLLTSRTVYIISYVYFYSSSPKSPAQLLRTLRDPRYDDQNLPQPCTNNLNLTISAPSQPYCHSQSLVTEQNTQLFEIKCEDLLLI